MFDLIERVWDCGDHACYGGCQIEHKSAQAKRDDEKHKAPSRLRS
jgi:hypothetical protein